MPGVLELLPRQQVEFQRLLDQTRTVFERFGFLPISTPAIEHAEILLTKTGGDTERQVYFVQSTGSLEQGDPPELALRFDLTVPLARYVAEHQNELIFPFRRYQIQPVYRGESPQRGRFREFYQADVDIVGRDELSLTYDAEVVAVISQVFGEINIGDFTVRINNRKLLTGLLSTFGITESAEQAAVMRGIDKLEKLGVEKVRAELLAAGHDIRAVDAMLDVATEKAGSGGDALSILDGLPSDDEMARRGMEELRVVFDTISALQVPEPRYCLDLSIARGLDYYTGTVYETTLDDHPAIGSICSGGRYEDLVRHYSSTSLPGVGISIGWTRLYWQLRELGVVGGGETPVKVYVTVMDDAGVGHALGIAATLRDRGVPTEVALEPSRLGKQLKYADRSGIRFVVIAGPDERAAQKVTLKDLVAQTQIEIPEAELTRRLTEGVDDV